LTVDHQFEGIGRLAAGAVVTLPVAGRAGIPVNAAAVMLNVTVADPAGAGFLTVYPCGSHVPLASSVNYSGGQLLSNAVLAKLDDGGRVCLFTMSPTDVVVDVSGYVPAGGSLVATVPARMLETRVGPTEVTVDHQFEGVGRLAAGAVLTLPVAGRAGIPADAAAVMLNVTVVDPAATGYVTVYPCGARPLTSTVNFAPGQLLSNAVLAKLDDAGRVCVFTMSPTDVVVDVTGYVPAHATDFDGANT
jgi:hypothetical protein